MASILRKTGRFILNLFLFTLIFYFAQFTREFIARPLVVKVMGPIKVEKHLYIDESFSIEETLMIVSAARQWEKSTNGIVKVKFMPLVTAANYLTLTDPKAVAITKMETGEPFIIEVENSIGAILGLHTYRFPIEFITIVYDRIEDDLELRSVVMHELGHAWGLDDTDTELTLMYRAQDKSSYSITNEDLVNFCLIYFCDPKKLSH